MSRMQGFHSTFPKDVTKSKEEKVVYNSDEMHRDTWMVGISTAQLEKLLNQVNT